MLSILNPQCLITMLRKELTEMFVWSCYEILTRECLIMLLSHVTVNVYLLDDNMATSRAKRTSLIVMYSFDIYFITSDLRSKVVRHKIFTRLRTCKNSPIAVDTKSMINKLTTQTITYFTLGFLTYHKFVVSLSTHVKTDPT